MRTSRAWSVTRPSSRSRRESSSTSRSFRATSISRTGSSTCSTERSRRRVHVRPRSHVGASRLGVRPAARRSARAGVRHLRRGRLLRVTAGVQPVEWSLRRSARAGAAARDSSQLRVVQPRVRARGSRAHGAGGADAPGSSTSRRHARVVERTRREVRGFAQRGTAAWHTMYTGFATQLWSYGGRRLRRRALRDRSSCLDASDLRLPGGARDAGPTTGSSSAGTSSRWTSDAADTG